MGGTRAEWINEPANLLTLCGSGTTQCHGVVEHAPEWAEAHGYSVRRWQAEQVATVPVWTWRGWVLLPDGADEWTPAGQVVLLTDHPGVDGCLCGCRALEPAPAGLWSAPTL
jgi:hypothetical protein